MHEFPMEPEQLVNYDSSGSAYNSPTLPISSYNFPPTEYNKRKLSDFNDSSKVFMFEDEIHQRNALGNELSYDNLQFSQGSQVERSEYITLDKTYPPDMNRPYVYRRHDGDGTVNLNTPAQLPVEPHYFGPSYNTENTTPHMVNYPPQNQISYKDKSVPLSSAFNFVPYYSKNVRRSETINLAFAAVRNCIPNVSKDTKLSKIQTLRLAISYIRFLMTCVGDYRFLMLMSEEDKKAFDSFFHARQFIPQIHNVTKSEKKMMLKFEKTKSFEMKRERKRQRTRWPQHVWERELEP